MIIIKTVHLLEEFIQQKKELKLSIGFVPTMGALHQGHLSLIAKSKVTTDITICSIFINPTQFNDVKDFEKYPVTIEQDIYLLEKSGCDVLFLPSVAEIYPSEFQQNKTYSLGFIENVFEGEHRPGHFNGVCMIVEKLLNIVQPHFLFLGQKDYQQCIVIKKLIELMNINIDVIICETLREQSGLAFSSRNQRLSPQAKEQASLIYQSFLETKQHINESNAHELIEFAKQNFLQNGFDKIDYLSIANAETLEPLSSFSKNTKTVILTAVFINGIRLIDNMLLS